MKWPALAIPALATMVIALSACTSLPKPYKVGQHAYDAPPQSATKGVERYLLYIPEAAQNGGKKWPLLVFLHGSGESGSNIDLVKMHGPPKLIEQGQSLPFIIASPQLQPDLYWDSEAVMALINALSAKLPIDTDRIYLTGLSLGGYGTWDTAVRYPDRLAAIAPIAGRGDTERACDVSHIPVWAFHGAEDNIVPPAGSIDMVAAIRTCGGDPRLTIYPDVGHDSWTQTYADEQFYDWLLRHRRP